MVFIWVVILVIVDMVYTGFQEVSKLFNVVILVIMDMVYTIEREMQYRQEVVILVIMDMVYTLWPINLLCTDVYTE